jgi:DNA-binding NarL/FixJ family response regulator
MAQLAEPLVGRDAELTVLDGLLDEAFEGVHRFSAVSGEPGIGKTSLIAEFAARAEERGCLVLAGRATELERDVPFGMLIDGFDAYLESLDPRTYDRLAADGLEELASVFPALRALGAGSAEPKTPAERFRAYYAVRELVERLAARQPLVMVFDDIHWSDGASLELLGYLLRRPAQGAVLGLIALRTGQATPAITATIEDGVERGQVTHIQLGPLGRDAFETLVPSDEAARVDRLYAESAGNPFYLLQLMRGASPVEGGIPPTVSAAIARELEGLSPEGRKLAEAAAVAGDPFELDLAVAVAEMPEPDALQALDELIARDLLRPGEVPRRFQFRHPLVRAAVYEACSPGSRLAAHERAAKALADRGAAPASRAHHVEQSARHGDAAAVAVLREAGQAAAERAPTSAARWLEAALRILPANAPPPDRTELLVALAGAHAATGNIEGSHTALLETLSVGPDDAPMPRVKLISACAGVEQLLGRHQEAHNRLERALDDLSDPASPEAATLMFELAVDAFYGQDYEGMRDWAGKARDTARDLGDRPLTAAGAGLMSFACSLQPETIAEAHPNYDEAAGIVDSMSDDELAKDLNAVAWLAAAEFYLDRYPEGTAHAERGLAVARATGQSEFFPGLIQALANLLFNSGRPREAAELLDGAAESARLSNNTVGLAWSMLNRSFASTAAGELEEAVGAGELAVQLTADFGESPVAVWAAAVYGIALLESGEAGRALEVLTSACGGDELRLVPGPWRVNWLEVSTRCYLGLDRLEDAERIAQLAHVEAERFALPLCTARANAGLGAVALAKGDAKTAADRALASAAGAEEMGARIDAARARMLAAEALSAQGKTEAAAEALQRAAADFDGCGAPRRRDRAERELRKLGHSIHRRTAPGKAEGGGIDSLTGRELEVVRLVADRRTNPEIAAELFLSIKTVETHLRNIFRKLGVSSRVEVARAVERAGTP